ncbi:MAG: 50S ribosomal protein L11 methyltransferase [Actinomycetota bacterium]
MSSVLVAVDPDDGPGIASRLRTLGAHTVTTDTQDADVSVIIAWFAETSVATDVVRELRAAGESAVVGPASPGAMWAWDRHTAPVRLPDDSCVCFPWSRFDRSRYPSVVTIDPGPGAGVGRHATTVLILGMLPHDLDGKRVIDVGSGSGVLGIVAAARGATVNAIDVDPAAIETTVANARRNRVDSRLLASTKPLSELRAVGDLVLANLHAATIEMLAADLRRVTDNGTLVISGFSSVQLPALLVALGSPKVLERSEADGWVAASLTWA